MVPSHAENEGSESESLVSNTRGRARVQKVPWKAYQDADETYARQLQRQYYRQEESLTPPPLNSRSVKGIKIKPQAVDQEHVCSKNVVKYLTKWSIEFKMGEHSDVENILTWFKFALRRPWSNTSLVINVMRSFHLREALEIWPFIAATCGEPSESPPMQDPYHQYNTAVSAFLGPFYAQTLAHRNAAAMNTFRPYDLYVV